MTTPYDHLLGIPFKHGSTDCYNLGVRYYKDVCGLILRDDYARPNDWWIHGMDLYRDNFAKEGFKQVDINHVNDIKIHDALLIAIPDPRCKGPMVPNHLAIYVGDGKILHHRLGKTSSVELYKGAMRSWTSMVVRHKDIKYEPPKSSVKFDIMEKILPHKREILEKAMRDANRSRIQRDTE